MPSTAIVDTYGEQLMLMDSVPRHQMRAPYRGPQEGYKDGVSTYLPDDTHWAEAGHRVVAEALHAVI